MFARLFIGLLVLHLIGWQLIRADLIPDLLRDPRRAAGPGRRRSTSGGPGTTTARPTPRRDQYARIYRLAPTYVVLYAIVFTLVAFDGIMALQPHWFSNLLGGFFFMGSFLGAHMLLALMTIYGAAHLGVADLVSPKQRHDLGKLCFGFTVFWTYLMWAQFLVIWYGNLPEETGFVFARLWGHWLPIGSAVVLGMFIVPVLRPAGRRAQEDPADARLLRDREPRRALAGALPAGDAVGHAAARPGRRRSRDRGDASLRWALPALLRPLRADLPDGLAAPGGDHARPRAGPRQRARRGGVRCMRKGPKDYVAPELIERRSKPR